MKIERIPICRFIKLLPNTALADQYDESRIHQCGKNHVAAQMFDSDLSGNHNSQKQENTS